MSFRPEAPWTEPERLYLLAEILKEAAIPSQLFLRIIVDSGVEPRWNDIPLPQGRSLRSCQAVFASMAAAPLIPSPMRPPPSFSSPVAPPSEPTDTPNSKKRSLPGKEVLTPGARALQPRPAAFSSINGQNLSSPYPGSVSEDALQPPRKKRGRPSKADIEARAAAAAMRGEVYPPPKPAKVQQMAAPAATTATTTTTAAAPTPGQTMTEDAEAAAKGKKRRGRPTKEESTAKRQLLEAAAAAAAASDQAHQPAAAAAAGPVSPVSVRAPTGGEAATEAGADSAAQADAESAGPSGEGAAGSGAGRSATAGSSSAA